MPKIFIDPGHGGSDPGAVSRVRESDLALKYGDELGKALAKLGIETGSSRNSDTFVSLSEIAKIANSWPADFFVSLHFNAGGGTGIETFVIAKGGKAEALAKSVQASLIRYTGAVDRGVKTANFQVLRDTDMPAILIKLGFMDSLDIDRITSEEYRRNCIRGITSGICSYLGIEWIDPYETATADDKIAKAKEYLKAALRELGG